MSAPATFAPAQHALEWPGGKSLILEPLETADGVDLGVVFAGIDPWAAYGYPPAALSAFLSASELGTTRFALRLGDDLAGAAVIRSGWLRGPYLQFLGVVPEYQGRGLGSALLAWMEQQARAAKERNLWVAASEINAGALRLYERHGFKQVAKLDDLAWDGRAEILMRKRL
jgi:ribosomal protein S18 acetylase RimI-like enzyme